MPSNPLHNYPRLKKTAKALLVCLLVLGATLLIVITFIFPGWGKPWYDFRPTPPYIPFSVPMQMDKRPYTATTYFIASKNDEPLIIFLDFFYKDHDTEGIPLHYLLLDTSCEIITSSNFDGNSFCIKKNYNTTQRVHQYKIDISEAVAGKEETLFSGMVINPTSHSWGSNDITTVLLTRKAGFFKKNRMYRVQVMGEFIDKRVIDLTQKIELRLRHGYLAK